MVEVVLALAAIAVTAAIVMGDARPPGRREPTPPAQAPFEELPAMPATLLIEQIDAPTEAADLSELPTQLASPAALAESTFALPLPSSQALPSALPQTVEGAIGKPHPRPDPDRLIQTEVLLPEGSRAQAIAVTRLVIGITAAGLALGLGILGLSRAISLLFGAV
jgi:hypothetical protein